MSRHSSRSRRWRLIRAYVLQEAGGRCLCGGQAAGCDGRAVEVHHLRARELGGSDRVSNLAALSAVCHARAHGKRPPRPRRPIDPAWARLVREARR